MKCVSCGSDNASGARFCNGCGAPLAAETEAVTLESPPPRREVLFGRYEVIEELGRGGMGKVLRVLDTKVHEEVALKLIRPQLAEKGETLERFRNELKLARRISHRNVCRMFDFDEVDGTPFISMEYIEGRSLNRLLKESGKLPMERLLPIAEGICRGLAEAHRLGVVHRDLKPHNVMLDSDGEPRILDFGIARSTATSGLTEMGTMLGTPEYMSPEQVSGAEIDRRSDIYSLGVILFEMAIGRLPFEADTPLAVALKHKTTPAPDPRSLDSDLDPTLARVILTCLQKNPDDRFSEATEILAELRGRPRESSATLFAATASLPAFLDDEVVEAEPGEEPVFAGREAELARLDGFLDPALAGRGQVVFITGESGGGKSTLSIEFARRAQERHADLVVAAGRCDAQTGSGDPYHPFRQILEMLSGDVEAQWSAGAVSRLQAGRLWSLIPRTCAALVEHGPDLIETLLPGRPLLTRAAACGGYGQEWYDRLEAQVERLAALPPASVKETQVLEQYTRVLLSLAQRKPLLLLLDDLHWVDAGSANLLFHLGRRLAESPVMVVGTCRTAELALGRNGDRHPLQPVLNELQRDFGSIEIRLDDSEDRQFLDAYVDSRANRLGKRFREALFRQTRGHPLFTVELLRNMVERGMLKQDSEGKWVEGPELDWEALPGRTEGVISERIDRVPAELREILDLASVEGVEFTAEAIARVLDRDSREVVKSLSGELDKRHRLVKAIGIRRIGGGRLSLYRFRHLLFRSYLYGQLDEVERSYHHEEVAGALEELYGESVGEVVVQLAGHFEIAGNAEKAILYHRAAGGRALRLSAFREATRYLERALELLCGQPASAERDLRELELRMSLVLGLIATEGFGSAGLEQNFRRVRELCKEPPETTQGVAILYSLWGFNFVRGHAEESRELAEQLVELAARTDGPFDRATADRVLGTTLFYAGDLDAALEPLERAAAAFDIDHHEARMMAFSNDPPFDAWLYCAWCHMLRGSLERGWAMLNEAVAAAETTEDPFCLATALCFRAGLGYDYGLEPAEILKAAQGCVELSEAEGFPFWLAHASIWAGWAAIADGQGDDGLAEIQKGQVMIDAIGTVVPYASVLVHLADAYRRLDRRREGLEACERALAASAGCELDRFYDAEAHRVQGELLRLTGKAEEAAASFRRARQVAAGQGAALFELRAALAEAELLAEAGDPAAARGCLEPLRQRFGDGEGSTWLQRADELLIRLGDDAAGPA